MYSLLMGVSPYDGARDVALLQSVAITEAPAELMQAEPSSEDRAELGRPSRAHAGRAELM